MIDVEVLAADVRRLVDRQAIEDTLYRYASSIDAKDFAALRATLAEDAVGTYGDLQPIVGADALVEWIAEQTADREWLHHLVNVYHVDIDGECAKAVTYHMSHQRTEAEPDRVVVVVARYHDTLRRERDGRWTIAHKVMEVGWQEVRSR